MLSEADVTKLETKLASTVKAAKGKYEVTADMLRKSARVKACVRTISDELHKRRIYFRPFRNKPVLELRVGLCVLPYATAARLPHDCRTTAARLPL